MLSDSQRTIIKLIHDNGGQVTKAECVEKLKGNYYTNASKYVGDILSRMVNIGYIERIKKGVFKISDKPKGKMVTENKDQIKLF